MKTHHSPLAAAITLAFALSAAGMSAGAAGPGTTAPAAAPPTATPGAGQMPPLGPWPGAGMNPGQGSMMGPGQGPRGRGWGRGMNPQMMQEHWGMMQQNVQAIETHLTNIESLLRELVQLQKGPNTR
jgi:hypothetical protein